jgi:RHS repeat-associated protein
MQKLSVSKVIKEPGYVYINISNEGSVQPDVFFDDLKVEHVKSPIVQQDDYYPFGLAFNSYQRENSTLNSYQYNGKELQNELDLGWLDYGARMYQSDLGRFSTVDPLVSLMPSWSPYNYTYDNPINFIDPTGMAPDKYDDDDDSSRKWTPLVDDTNEPSPQERYWESKKYLGPTTIATCPTCPTDEKYDGYRGSSIEYAYDSESEIVYLDANITVTPTLGNRIEDMAYAAWNSAPARVIVPDFVSVGVGFTAIAPVGGATNFDLNWVTRGPEASWKPVYTTTLEVGVGYSIDATVNIGGTVYLGNVNDIRRDMLQTSIGQGDVTYWGSAGVAAGGKIGVTGTYTPTPTGYGLLGGQINIGGGLPLGPLPVNAAGGVSNTIIIE